MYVFDFKKNIIEIIMLFTVLAFDSKTVKTSCSNDICLSMEDVEYLPHMKDKRLTTEPTPKVT